MEIVTIYIANLRPLVRLASTQKNNTNKISAKIAPLYHHGVCTVYCTVHFDVRVFLMRTNYYSKIAICKFYSMIIRVQNRAFKSCSLAPSLLCYVILLYFLIYCVLSHAALPFFSKWKFIEYGSVDAGAKHNRFHIYYWTCNMHWESEWVSIRDLYERPRAFYGESTISSTPDTYCIIRVQCFLFNYNVECVYFYDSVKSVMGSLGVMADNIFIYIYTKVYLAICIVHSSNVFINS